MNKSCFLLTGALALFILSGCTSVKRFKTAAYKGEDPSLVDVELFNTRLSAGPELSEDRNLWTLSANAQTRLVQILDERFPDNERFISAMSDNYGPGDPGRMDFTRKDLRMVFSITKERDYTLLNDPGGRFSPADRIEYLRLGLEIPESYGLRFHEWNRYVTEYGEFHVADVSFSRNLDLSLEGAPGGADMGGGVSMGRDEKQELNRRYLKLNGSINDQRMVIEAEGTRETDLTGNVTADVSLQFDAFPELLMVPRFERTEEGRKVLGAMEFVHVPVPAMRDAPDTIYADLTLHYIYRHVETGWKTFAEWDDEVAYYQGSIARKVPLFLKKDYLPAFYCIGTVGEGKHALKLGLGPEKEYLLQFGDYATAGEFLAWLESFAGGHSGPVQIDSMELLYEGAVLRAEAMNEVRFRVLPVY